LRAPGRFVQTARGDDLTLAWIKLAIGTEHWLLES
jgi:hypothetical protein